MRLDGVVVEGGILHLVRLRDMKEATGGLGDEEDVGDAGTGFGVEVEEVLRMVGVFGEEPEGAVGVRMDFVIGVGRGCLSWLWLGALSWLIAAFPSIDGSYSSSESIFGE